MKKILSVFSAAILLLTAVSCLKEDAKITVNPSKGENPVLVSSDTEEDIVVEYTPAQFYYGNDAVNRKLVYHALILVSLNGKEMNVNMNAKDDVAANTLTLKANNFKTQMGSSVYGLKDGQQCTAEFVVRGSVSSTLSGGNLDSEGRISYAFEFTVPKGDPYAAYTQESPWGIVGNFNGWGNDVEMVSNGTLHVAKKVTLAANDEFKFRKDADWKENFGFADGVESYVLGEEFALKQDGANIVIAEDGEYDIFLDPEAGTAKIIKSVAILDPYAAYTQESPWGLVGSFSSWGNDVVMVTDGTLHVAKAVALNKGAEAKFRKDADWKENFGFADGVESYVLGEEFALKQDGANIVIAEDGVYDFILDPENATAKIIISVASEAGDTPEPEPKPKVWSLIGTLEDSGWDKDYDLTNTSGDVWTIQNVFVREKDEFKIRADHDWAKSYGGPEENAESTYEEGNVYGVYQPTLGESFAAGGKNIRIGVEGYYNVTLTYGDEPTILIEEYREYPSICS